jgi:hypothetical protein
MVSIGVNGKGQFIGYFGSLSRAIAARRAAELKYWT